MMTFPRWWPMLLLMVGGTAWCAWAADPAESKSALETDPQGWIDLLAGDDLFAQWGRVPLPPGSRLSAKNPWSLDPQTRILRCDGVGVHENLQYKKEFGDGILHVEWRFQPVEGKKGYNSGVYVRNSADGRVWHQAQVGNQNVGFIFGDTLVDGQLKRVRLAGQGPQRGKEPGQWNVFEITCQGPRITLWVNGAVTCEWKDCQVRQGQVGLEAEGWVIEFRNVKFKESR
ncbi:MAG: DUF1080 domain-containing protein [Gemmataceae bacterium]|nr:DUF1080 domain-containing protein [Gemmataceae bacterium]MDW8265187.1 DUF1080 domain-containing protein [Gemmataceae bacterium]